MSHRTDRRTLVRLLGTVTIGGIAGCSTPDESDGQPSPTESPTTTPTRTTMPSEPTPTPETDQTAADGLVIVSGEDSVEATVSRITDDIEESPLTLVTTVDHAANAASVGEELPPTTLLLFGNPAVGTPLMQAARSTAIDLPQKMLVYEENGRTYVAYNDPGYLARRHGIDDQEDRLGQIRSVLDRLATGDE